MNEINFTSAQYKTDPANPSEKTCINATIGNRLVIVPLIAGNRHYDEIMRQVEAGTLVIAEAD